jgi:pSer/pThr/pTyr-binding forkhead associated (FHA) protein
MAFLTIVSGEQAGSHYRLSLRPLVAGRHAAAEIQIVDPKVSRRHFLVRRQGDEYVIQDLRTRNGVWVNGKRVRRSRSLADGDRIIVGDTTLTFDAGDAPGHEDALHRYRQVGTEASARTELGEPSPEEG